MAVCYVKVAVSDLSYWVDRPYTYLVPPSLAERAAPGMRVAVPFSRNNRRAEGVILSVSDHCDFAGPKPVQELLDEAPVLTERQIALALWMRERFFCTVYEAVKAILPAGLWFDSAGRRRASDKLSDWLRLAVSPEEALELAARKEGRSKAQATALRLLSAVGEGSLDDLRALSGATRQSLKALCTAGVLELFQRERLRRPEFRRGAARAELPELNAEQSGVLEGLTAMLDKAAAGALLFGVTGSGKTAVYIRLIAECLNREKTAILLVPEIALTPQMLETFSSYFGEDIAVLHSSLTVAERYDEWKRVRRGEAHLVIGTRSAVFAPTERLGLVILDEEQEDTYKSENAPRYHARDVAKFRCAQDGALLLLGSATPLVASRYQAEVGNYAFFELNTRYNRRPLPEVSVVDMKRELRAGNASSISSVLRRELQKNIDSGEQSILFLNRRGTARLIACADCGYTFQCPNCSMNLTYHAGKNSVICHVCGYARRVSRDCPACGGRLHYTGDGTEKVEQQLSELFPGVELLRVDTDTVSAAGGHGSLFARFREERIPIMVGTQMVTKGLNFDNVTLVGVLLADQSLYAGNYRAGERTFSLITQVIGRSGRASMPGRAIIQTFTPENQVIRHAARQDYEGFYRSEIALRRVQHCPPFTQLIALTLRGQEEHRVLACASEVKALLLHGLRGKSGADVLGPAPYPVVRAMGNYRYLLTLRCQPDREIRTLVSRILIHCNTKQEFRGVSVYADMDPLF